MKNLNIQFNKGFIKDLTGIDCLYGDRLKGLLGFFVVGIKKQKTNDSEQVIFYRGLSDFINLDNRFNYLMTNLYLGDADSVSIGSQIDKLIYYYEPLYDTTEIKIDENGRINFPFIELTKNNILTDNSISTLSKLNEEIKKFNEDHAESRIIIREAFEVSNNTNALTSISPFEAFRPIIDIHTMKVMTNLISVTNLVNPLTHTHGTYTGCIDNDNNQSGSIITSKTDLSEINLKGMSVNSITEFIKDDNHSLEIEPVDVCYEDWNLLNIKL